MPKEALLNFSEFELQAGSDHMLRGVVKTKQPNQTQQPNKKQPKTNSQKTCSIPGLGILTYHVQSYELVYTKDYLLSLALDSLSLFSKSL